MVHSNENLKTEWWIFYSCPQKDQTLCFPDRQRCRSCWQCDGSRRSEEFVIGTWGRCQRPGALLGWTFKDITYCHDSDDDCWNLLDTLFLHIDITIITYCYLYIYNILIYIYIIYIIYVGASMTDNWDDGIRWLPFKKQSIGFWGTPFLGKTFSRVDSSSRLLNVFARKGGIHVWSCMIIIIYNICSFGVAGLLSKIRHSFRCFKRTCRFFSRKQGRDMNKTSTPRIFLGGNIGMISYKVSRASKLSQTVFRASAVVHPFSHKNLQDACLIGPPIH